MAFSPLSISLLEILLQFEITQLSVYLCNNQCLISLQIIYTNYFPDSLSRVVLYSLQACQVALVIKHQPAVQETREMQVRALGWQDPLEEDMAPLSNTLAWETPQTEEPGVCSPRSCKESDTKECASTLLFSFFRISHLIHGQIQLGIPL